MNLPRTFLTHSVGALPDSSAGSSLPSQSIVLSLATSCHRSVSADYGTIRHQLGNGLDAKNEKTALTAVNIGTIERL